MSGVRSWRRWQLSHPNHSWGAREEYELAVICLVRRETALGMIISNGLLSIPESL